MHLHFPTTRKRTGRHHTFSILCCSVWHIGHTVYVSVSLMCKWLHWFLFVSPESNSLPIMAHDKWSIYYKCQTHRTICSSPGSPCSATFVLCSPYLFMPPELLTSTLFIPSRITSKSHSLWRHIVFQDKLENYTYYQKFLGCESHERRRTHSNGLWGGR